MAKRARRKKQAKPKRARRAERAAAPQTAERRPPLREKPYDIKEGVTQSLLSDWVDCRQRCRFSLDGWATTGYKDSLEYGSLFHFMLERLYGLVARGVTIDPRAVDAGSTWMGDTLLAWRKRLAATASASDEQQTEHCIAQMLGVWDGYLREYPGDLKAGRWDSVESKFDVMFQGYHLRGMKDGRGRVGHAPWLLETKTRSQIGAGVELVLAFDFQNLFYLVADEAETGEMPVGVNYNIVRRPQHKVKEGESLPNYTARITLDVAKRPDHWFHRFEITYPLEVMQEFKRQLRAKLGGFALWVGLGGAAQTYRNEASCVKRWKCPFIALCAGDETGYDRDGRLFPELE